MPSHTLAQPLTNVRVVLIIGLSEAILLKAGLASIWSAVGLFAGAGSII